MSNSHVDKLLLENIYLSFGIRRLLDVTKELEKLLSNYIELGGGE